MLPTSPMCVGNVGVWSTRKTRRSFLWLSCSNGYCDLSLRRLLTRNWTNSNHALSQYRLPLEESVPLFAPLLLLSLPESRYAPLNLFLQRQRQKTLGTIAAILLELAERQPVLFILEDLHWTDPSTLELLGLLLD